ncbi:MAG: hypothetical protein ACJ71F_13025 [Nitrososphaeraceae archaeon]
MDSNTAGHTINSNYERQSLQWENKLSIALGIILFRDLIVVTYPTSVMKMR